MMQHIDHEYPIETAIWKRQLMGVGHGIDPGGGQDVQSRDIQPLAEIPAVARSSADFQIGPFLGQGRQHAAIVIAIDGAQPGLFGPDLAMGSQSGIDAHDQKAFSLRQAKTTIFNNNQPSRKRLIWGSP